MIQGLLVNSIACPAASQYWLAGGHKTSGDNRSIITNGPMDHETTTHHNTGSSSESKTDSFFFKFLGYYCSTLLVLHSWVL